MPESETGRSETPERRQPDAPVGRKPLTRSTGLKDTHAHCALDGDAENAVQIKGSCGRLLDAGPAQYSSPVDHDSVVGRLLDPEGQGARRGSALYCVDGTLRWDKRVK